MILTRRANIYLSGFMGAGKSTVGALLARRLCRAFVDTDKLIEVKAHRPISAIFKKQGEEAFRALEAEILSSLAGKERLVVGLGGGAVLRAANREILKRGIWIHLEVPFATLFRRLENTAGRPLASQGRDALETLWRRRAPLYAQADYTVFCGGFTADSVCQKIIDALK